MLHNRMTREEQACLLMEEYLLFMDKDVEQNETLVDDYAWPAYIDMEEN